MLLSVTAKNVQVDNLWTFVEFRSNMAWVLSCCFSPLYFRDTAFLSLRPSLPFLCISLSITSPHLSSFPCLRSYLFILSVLFCPSSALPPWCECFGVPLTCCVTCRCVSRRHQGSASGSLSRAEGITLTFRAGRRPSSYLMCWREAQPRACCSKTHLLPSLLRMPVQVHLIWIRWIW